jgi:hypothetical protein
MFIESNSDWAKELGTWHNSKTAKTAKMDLANIKQVWIRDVF